MMIKRLSESWKQQKSGRNPNFSRPSGLRKLKKTSILRHSNLNIEEHFASATDKFSKKKSPTGKTTKVCEITSLDWGASDSLFAEQDEKEEKYVIQKQQQQQQQQPLLQNDFVDVFTKECKTEFTKVVTRSRVSTPQVKCSIKNKTKRANFNLNNDIISPVLKTSPLARSLSNTSPQISNSLNISQWGLPESIQANYKAKGIKTMFPWQKECLLQGKVLDGANLIYSAPTSAGKTLVAEILMLKRVLETKKKAIYILPFVSVAREKMYGLREQFEEAGVTVGGFMGNESPPGGINSVDIAICTIERANSIINRLMEESKLSLLGVVVIDEMHMIGDPGRGYLLELLLTKICFITSRNSLNNSNPADTIQLIGMSATLPNLDMLAEWLGAEYYFTDYRPIPLSEHLKVGKYLYDSCNKIVAEIPSSCVLDGDDDNITALCLEIIRERNSVLIFCPTKNWCEKLTQSIASYILENIFNKINENNSDMLLWNKEALNNVIEQLKQTPAGLDSTLEKVVSAGISFHHAGLTMDERDILEGAFRRGVLKVIVATSTLSSGVNLPARRVIIRSPMFHGKVLDPLIYKQMVGRAGRKGIDTKGESILVCKPNEKQKALALLSAQLKPVYSCLLDEDRSMKRALLEVIAGGVVVSPFDVELYAKSTFLNICLAVQTGRNPEELITNAMKFLLENDFIKLERNKKIESENNKESYYPSQLGAATLASSMKPDEALIVYAELQKARKSFCLENELHIIYQVTPTYLNDQWPDLDWYTYYNIWERLSSQSKRVAELVGVKESFLARAMQNRLNCTTTQQKQQLRIHRRFYAALILQDLVNEVAIPDVSKRYKVHKGLLQSLQNSSATFAGMVTVFCRRMGWNCLEVLIEQFQSRLSFGVCRELCNLVRISLLNRFTARLFYENGYQTVSAIAKATRIEVTKLLRDSTPFHSKKIGDETQSRTKLRHIWLTGMEGLTEQKASEMIIDEAKRIFASDAQALGISIDQIDHSFNNSTVKHSSGKKGKSTLRKTRKRLSIEKLTTRFSKRKSPNNKENSPKISEKQNNTELLSAEKIITKNRTVLTEVQFDGDNQKMEHVTEVQHDRDNQKTEYITEVQPDGCGSKTENDQNKTTTSEENILFESSNSLLITDSLLKPATVCRVNEPISPSLDISLRLSTTDEGIEEPAIVPPLKLHSQFDAACSNVERRKDSLEDVILNKQDVQDLMPNNSLDGLLFSPSNSNNLFETNVFVKENLDTVSNTSKDNTVPGEFLVIDVTASKSLFLTFLQEWKDIEKFSFCFSCESCKNTADANYKIGRKVRNNKLPQEFKQKKLLYSNDDIHVTGIAVCWGQKDAYFIDLQDTTLKRNSLDDTSLPPDVSNDLPLPFRMKCIQSVLNTKCKKDVVAFDMKDQLKILFELTDCLLPTSNLFDPKVAQWLLEPGQREKNLHGIVKQWLSEEFICLTEGIGGGFGSRGLGLVPKPGSSGRVRSCVECVLVYELMKVLEGKLHLEELYLPFCQIEMPALRVLSVIEINGIGFSDEACETLKKIMKDKLTHVENLCYHFAKRPFSLTSPDDVGRVLFVDLSLPCKEHTETARTTRNKGKIKHFRTSKDVLEKLVKYHRLPKLILEWRRINNTLTKVVYPVQRKKLRIQPFSMHRIYCEAQFHTSTGRVTFSEPNIQNVPKEFDVKVCTEEEGKRQHGNNVSPGKIHVVSMRSTFVPFEGGVFVSADYSQLELRIMAHLSSDNKLLRAINNSADVFKSIASQINRVPIEDVTTVHRQQAKQICYGILYGIGIKSLAEQLSTTEEEASVYMESFKCKYNGVSSYIKKIILDCRSKGYVETMSGRKRYLPAINSTDVHAKAQAERQAVNTAVQGSAADLVKAAMNKIDVKLHERFESSCLKRTQNAYKQRGAFLVLQLHDELIYEVNRKDLDSVLNIIRDGMEKAYKLTVGTPVKIHVGNSWGMLKDVA